MYNIYFNKRVLNICNFANLQKKDPNSVYMNGLEAGRIAEIPFFFEHSQNIKNLVVCTDASNIETTFNEICSAFTKINAAGGLVENEKGEYLLIRRNGIWDLPKGKQEDGEDIALTALREVEEECGISGLEQKELICITRHTYRMNGNFMLKHTYWYRMVHRGEANLVPQGEEGIEECVWVAPEKLPEYLKNTYPSIKEVFENK